MKLVSNRKWTLDPETAAKVKEWLQKNGSQEDTKITSPYEEWRIRYSDATITFYKKGIFSAQFPGFRLIRSYAAGVF